MIFELEKIFYMAKLAGYEGLELVIDNNPESRNTSYIRKLEKKHQLPVLSIHSAIGNIKEWGNDKNEYINNSQLIAEKLEIEKIVIHSNKISIINKNILPNKKIFIENMPNESIKPLLKISNQICLDTSHLPLCFDPYVITKKYHKEIKHIHLSDNSNKVDEHLIPGNGSLSLKKMLNYLSKNNYQGVIVIELIPENYINILNDKHIIKKLKEAQSFVLNEL